jgi:hypothetical protein
MKENTCGASSLLFSELAIDDVAEFTNIERNSEYITERH